MPLLKASSFGIVFSGAVFAFMLLCSPRLFSQESPSVSIPTFSVSVDLVNVFATVRDKRGSFIKDLTRDDFTLYENGRKQTIRNFSRETNLPLTIGLIVDTTPSESNMMEEEIDASRIFLNKILRKGKDKAFLIQFGDEAELVQDLTSSPEEIEEALGLLQWSGTDSSGTAASKPSRRRRSPPGLEPNFYTILADTVSLVSEEIMSSQQGRKALIILGDGYHVGDRLEMAIAAAQKADTLIYSIRIYDKGYGGNAGGWSGMGPFGFPGGGFGESDWKENLKAFSRKTGGSYFEAGKKEKLEETFAKIEEELRSQYSIGYTPEDTSGKAFRKIKVQVQKKGMAVHSREGYYPRIKRQGPVNE